MIEFIQLGLNEYIEKLQSTNKNFRNIIDSTMDKARHRAKELAEEYVPEDTTILRQSIYTELIDNGFIIGADAPYAVFNEYGSITTPAGDVSAPIAAKYKGQRPFLRPALYQLRNEMRQIFGEKLQNVTNIRVMGETL